MRLKVRHRSHIHHSQGKGKVNTNVARVYSSRIFKLQEAVLGTFTMARLGSGSGCASGRGLYPRGSVQAIDFRAFIAFPGAMWNIVHIFQVKGKEARTCESVGVSHHGCLELFINVYLPWRTSRRLCLDLRAHWQRSISKIHFQT